MSFLKKPPPLKIFWEYAREGCKLMWNPLKLWKQYKAQQQEIHCLSRKNEVLIRDLVEATKVVSDVKLQYQCFWEATKELYPDFHPVIKDFANNKFQTIKNNQQASYCSIKRDYTMNKPIPTPQPKLNLVGGVMSHEEYCLREGIING